MFLWASAQVFAQPAAAKGYLYDSTVVAQKIRHANALAASPLFAEVVARLTTLQTEMHKEQVVSFGKDSSGITIASPIRSGNFNNASLPGIHRRFADIHIHTSEHPPSSGDIYGFSDQAIADSQYLRLIVTPQQTIYALIMVDPKAAIAFNNKYPRRAGIKKPQADGSTTFYQPTFPQELVDAFNRVRGWLGATRAQSLAYLLIKYKSGIRLLQRGEDGHFMMVHAPAE